MLKNMTPHPIAIYRLDRQTKLATIQPSGQVIRLEEIELATAGQLWLELSAPNVWVDDWEETENYVLSVPVVQRAWGGTYLEKERNMLYIVSMPVLMALPPRPDLLCPDTGSGAVRDDEGKIIGTTRLISRQMPMPVTTDWRWTGERAEIDRELHDFKYWVPAQQ